MTKKVIIVIVEGDSDESFLIGRLREKYRNYEIRFDVQHGDIMYNYSSKNGIKIIVGDAVKAIVSKRKYTVNDVIAVVHVMDTDGCLISESSIKIGETFGTRTFYRDDCILVSDKNQKDNIAERNQDRSKNILIMNSVTAILGNAYDYQLYYFSRNLEHVVFNEPNPNKDGKCDHIDDFIENLDMPIEQYLRPYLPEIDRLGYSEKVDDSEKVDYSKDVDYSRSVNYHQRYRESWEFIEEGINSLKRYTNVPLLFEYLDSAVAFAK